MTENMHAMRRLALGTSVIALGLGIATGAQAQCAPDPTVAYGTTMCAGTDNDGIRVTTTGTFLQVLAGATVTNTGAPAVTVDVPHPAYAGVADTVNILGTVSATGQNAIAVTSGSLTGGMSGYSFGQIYLSVGTGGSVTGATALSLLQSAGNTSGTLAASIDNAGTMTGTGGTALRGNIVSTANGYASAITSFAIITNRAGGSIVGGILGPVSTLTNAGSIDGGSGSAIDSSAGFSPIVTNAAGGTIRSSSTAATVLAGSTMSLTVTNAGTIANAGNGPALSGGMVSITNQAGGRISTVGATAITAATSLSLVNAGAVTGSVTTGNGASSVDSTAGTINGALTFGNGNDTLIARYTGTRTLVTGVTGAIDAGGGTNTERVVFATDTSVTTPVDLNTGFQQLVLAPAVNVTATLQPGFTTSTGLVLAGQGTVANRAALSLTGTAVTDLDYAFGSVASFRNEGSITTTTNNQAGLNLSNHSLTNIGSITVNGGTGVSMSFNPVNNSGSITASGTGVNIFDGVLTNSGTIVSTGGSGATLFGNVGYTGSNSGTIRGATTGVDTFIYFTNTGTIGSAKTAVAVEPYGYLINAAGGVVNGGSGGAATISAFNAGIANAGTINGNVTDSGDSSTAYFALPGGTLNGNLAIGNGTLVTGLVNTGPGQFAGITGTVTASSGGTLRYAINADANTVLPAGNVGPFSTAGYQLANNAALTLTAPAGQTRSRTLMLAGTGSVDLTAAIGTTNAAAIQSTSVLSYPGAAANAGPLSIVSRGSLTVTRADASVQIAAVQLFSTDSFTNAGTIAMTDRTGYSAAAISGGGTVVNAGTITLNGATGISGATTVTNTGSIIQASGGAPSRGVTGITTFTNQGVVNVGGSAVQLGDYGSYNTMITNSGTLASTGSLAIADGAYSYGTATINNLAGGTIAGVGQAIRVSAGALTNAGTIVGSVDLGYQSATSRSYAGSTYVANGGTLTGDLAFGDGSDLLLIAGSGTGVSGIVDGGGGRDILGHMLTATGSVSIDLAGTRNFEDALVQAATGDTVATATATGTFTGNLYAAGPGSVVNQAALTGALVAGAPSILSQVVQGDTMLAVLTNTAGVAGGVFGTVPSFVNSGAIGSSTLQGAAVSLYNGGPLTFANSGTIQSNASGNSYYATAQLTGTGAVSVTNTGQIAGNGLYATTYAGTGQVATLSLTNAGSVTAGGGNMTAATLGAYTSDTGTASITVNNSGTLAARGTSYANGLYLDLNIANGPATYALVNSGVISASTIGTSATSPFNAAGLYLVNEFYSSGAVQGTVTNAAGGVIAATSDRAYGIIVANHALNLVNAGTITATGTATSVAVQTYDPFANSIVNTGTINGDIVLAAGADTVSNAGAITGNVSLGAGNDLFVQRVGGTVSGLVDGGDGTDSYVVDTTGGTTSLAASNIANFERVTQTGTGTGSYSGSFGVGTVNLAGGTLSIASGQTLATTGATTITGVAGSGALSVVNAGTIAGGITLADGNDLVVNTGTIGGPVQLGSGDDTYVEGVGSIARGGVDGGGGTNLYRVVLAGDRTGIGARTNFQNLALDGTGTLGLALDQNYQTIALNGPSLSLTMGGYAVGQIVATSDMAARLSLDGQVGSVRLGAGNDVLTLMTGAVVSGPIDGGGGTDALVLDGSGTGTLGAAQVVNFESGVKQGSGTWTLAGTTAASPTNWTIAAGTLNVAGGNAVADNASVAIASGATLNLQAGETIDALTGAGMVTLGANTLTAGAGNGSGSFAGTIAGSGGLTKTGTGSLNLTGTNSYTGPTIVNAGRLAVNGSIASAVTVNSGGTLGGNGTVGSTIVARGGTFAPGNSIGTTTVAGTVTFAAGSTYQVEANAAGSADRINATGSAVLNGGTVQVLAASGTYMPLTNYTILTAAGGVTGRFASVTSNMAFLTPFLAYGANAVTLELGRNDIAFASEATTANGVAVANAITARGLGDTVYNTILVQSSTTAGRAFNALSGEIHATIPTAMIDSDRRVREVIMDRARVAQGDGLGLWMQAMDTYAYSRDQAQAFGFHSSRMGVYGGIDYAFGGFRVGISGGYLDDKLRVPALASRAEIETDIIGGSVSYAAMGGRLNATAGATHAWHHVGTTRNVDATGFASAYSADYNIKTTQAFGELGFDLLRGPVALTPFVRYDYDWSRADGFNEVGGPAALDVAAERRHNQFGTAGVRIAASYPIGNGLAIEPHASAAYLRTWDRLYSTRTETFAGTGPAFSVTGDRLGRDNLDANGGIDLVVSPHIRIGATGYVARSSDIRDYGGKGSVSVRF